MCAGCRSNRGRLRLSGYWGNIRSNPWKRRGESASRPWLWLKIWRFDFLFDPFNNWLEFKTSATEWGRYNRIGPVEASYIHSE